MIRTYLSIDLDYWLSDDYGFPKSFDKIFNKYIKEVPDKIIVDNHDQLLHHIARAGVERIIHIDYHQDIAYPTDMRPDVNLDCGSFYYYLPNKENIEFHWLCPSVHCWDARGYGICMNDSNPIAPSNWIFKKQTVCSKMNYKLLNSSDIVAAGVSISEDYCLPQKEVIANTVKYMIAIGLQNRSWYY